MTLTAETLSPPVVLQPSSLRESDSARVSPRSAARITSIDAVRGLNMFLMICVNNLAHNKLIPAWMQHHPTDSNGMTFVDIVFPAFLFIAGMSIPFALSSRLSKGEPVSQTFGHVLVRVLSLLLIGVMMVNGRPDPVAFGHSAAFWQVTMCLAVIAAFCTIRPLSRSASEDRKRLFRRINLGIRIAGFALLLYLAFAFRGLQDQRIIRLSPFSINAEWWGILGAIGWAYLVGSIVFLLFRTRQVAVLGCVALLVAMYFADQSGMFNNFWPAKHVSFGKALGTHAMLTTAGVLLGIMLMTPDLSAAFDRIKFTLLFIAGFAAGALLLNGQYGISKNNATPSWGLWSCAFTAATWLLLYLLGDVLRLRFLTTPLAIAGQNVLLAYVISLMFNSTLQVVGLSHWYVQLAPHMQSTLIRSAGTAVFIIALTFVLNRVGFGLKL